MNEVLLVLMLFFSLNLPAQKTKEVTSEVYSPIYNKEVFDVLKSDKSIKSGKYVRYGIMKSVEEKGQYENNKRIGIWEFYNYQGEVEQKYNYSEEKLIYSESAKSNLVVHTEIKGAFVDVKPEKLPVFIGGTSRLNFFILSKMAKYPVEAQRNGTQGTVIVSASITKEGTIIDEKVEHGIGSGCDETALAAIKNIPDDFIPATLDGENVNVKIFYPLNFKLN